MTGNSSDINYVFGPLTGMIADQERSVDKPVDTFGFFTQTNKGYSLNYSILAGFGVPFSGCFWVPLDSQGKL